MHLESSMYTSPVDVILMLHKSCYTSFHQHFGSDVKSVSFVFNQLRRHGAMLTQSSVAIRHGANTEQALILCDLTTKVLVKCHIYGHSRI